MMHAYTLTVRLSACLGLLAAPLAHATQPLRDLLVIDGRNATLAPPECCWVKMPESARLRDMRKAEMTAGCTAIGGPVGTFELRDRQLLLRNLRTCSGDIPLRDVFPDLTAPAPATWLTGTFTAHLGFVCMKDGRAVPEKEVVMSVVAGNVVDSTETEHARSACE